MKTKKNVKNKTKQNKEAEKHVCSIKGFGFLTLCAFCAVLLVLVTRVAERGNEKQVYAASDGQQESSDSSREYSDEGYLPTGIAGFVSGISETPVPGSTVYRIGSSCEQVMVGQRVQTVGSSVGVMDISASMENTVNSFDSKATSLAMTPKIMSDEDYDTLLKIVEAEAGGEDLEGKILVANVIMNRVKNDQFPDTVKEVVWDSHNGVAQFSPTYDGRINLVTVSDDTKEAVKQALNGVDHSEGALFFVQKSSADEDSVDWFEDELEWLFRHGVHDFYKFPDGDSNTAENEETQTVHMDTEK